MFSQENIQGLIHFITTHANAWLMPTMLTIFVVAVFLRMLVHFVAMRELWFSKEFYKRVHAYLDNKEQYNHHDSFYVVMKKLLEKTYYESFIVRAYMKRRDPDYVWDIGDRVFLIQDGCARLVKETLRQISFLRYQKERPRFIEIAKNVFDNNPCFKKVMGILPAQGTHDVLTILPGIFIIGGIFGTFLGIMAALPGLSEIRVEDVVGAKVIMDEFLARIAFSMSSSIIGIILSVLMTIVNTMFNPEKTFLKTLNKFENTMELLWDCCENNDRPSDIPNFDQHRDPIEALAEESVNGQMRGKERQIKVRENAPPIPPTPDLKDDEDEELEKAS